MHRASSIPSVKLSLTLALKALAGLALATEVHARELSKDEKLSDFIHLKAIIQNGYGPLEYKTSAKIVDVAALNQKTEAEILATKNNHEFYYKMVEYVAAYKDGHFGIELPVSKRYSLPILTDLVNGQVLITKIDTLLVPPEMFPFSVGDEIIEVDDIPILEFLKERSRYIGTGNERSRKRFASWSVFSRRMARMPKPNETLQLKIRRHSDSDQAGNDIGAIESVTLDWIVTGTDVESPQFTPFSQFPRLTRHTNFDRLDNLDLLDNLGPQADSAFACSGQTRIAIPADAIIIMQEPVTAYYYPTAKGNVGYLRLPHYSPGMGNPDGMTLEGTLTWVAQYEYAIQELEQNTVGLVIDQDHNCGGSVWVVNKMISLFMDRPFVPSKFALLGNKETYVDWQEGFAEAPPNTLEWRDGQRVLDLIQQTWLEGVSRLTPLISISGEAEFFPNFIRYTKPVVILIDEVAGSGGDMFPAMMKGLGRAKLFGQQTSGLGGHVQSYPVGLPYSQLRLRMTKSLFHHPDGQPIENNGAMPDRFYSPTRQDVIGEFKDYQKAYTDYLLEQLP